MPPIAKHTGGGSVEFSISGLLTLLTVAGAVIGVGIYVGTHIEHIGANAQTLTDLDMTISGVIEDVDDFKLDLLDEMHSIDRRLAQYETGTNTIRAQQIKVQKDLAETRETQSAIVANQAAIREEVKRANDGIVEIQRLIRGLR